MIVNDLEGKALDLFRQKKRAFQLTFGSPHGQEVLKLLSVFCRAEDNAAIPGDHDRTWLLIGRREVFLMIQRQLNLSSEELFALSGGQTVKRLAEQGTQQEDDNA